MHKEEEIHTNTDLSIATDSSAVSEVDQFIDGVLSSGQELIAKVLEEGAALYEAVADLEQLAKGDTRAAEVNRSHLIGKHTKRLALLHRDVIFEIQKACLLVKEGVIAPDKLKRLMTQSTQSIEAATEAYQVALANNSNFADAARNMVKQDHPWPIYKEQLDTIHQQMDQLIENKSTLEDLLEALSSIKKAISDRLDYLSQRVTEVVRQAEQINAKDDGTGIEEVIELLTNTNQTLDQSGAIAIAHAQIEKAIDEAPLHSVPKVGIAGGILVEEDLSPRYQLEQWYDVEILPLLEDGFQQVDTMTYNFRLALINITNRLELLINKNNGFILSEHLQPLHRFIEGVPQFRKNIDARIADIQSKIDENLSLSPLFDSEQIFLSLGIQGSIKRFKKEQNLLLDRVSYYWTQLKEKYFSIKSTVQEESRLGDVEKVIRYIQSSGSDRRNIHYNNFFNAKVTMVEAFWIGREIEQKRMGQVIESWNAGYHGAVLFYGDRYTGKSSLGDWMGQEYFRGKTYALQPGKSVLISNKKVQLTEDLLESIKLFLDRVQYARPVIWIDDLELWFDDRHMSDEVMIGLSNLINEYSKKVFFAVSMGSWSYKRLNRFLDLEHTFQSTIELTPFSNELLKEAILLRHGASHKSLIDNDGQELTKLEFDRHARHINGLAEGNIGHALQLWANSIVFKDEHHVELGEVLKYKFPDIINSDNGILLAALLMHRRMSETELAELLGPSYDERYKDEVARMIGYGVIRRSYNGTLSINDKVVPPITKALRKNKFI